ncbi:MAG TPA: sulfotransferase [Acidimicrobiia bacterium]|nr:sulfotransferase [Acidimicrobiia bacterium]
MSAASGPIFVGGLSYSGKTQVRSMLAAHAELQLTRRTALWDRYFGRFGDLDDPGALARCLDTMAHDPRLDVLAPDVVAIERQLADGPRTYARVFGMAHARAAERAGKRRWGEQLGFVERYADAIFAEHPDACMIHMIRDPRDRAAEMFAAGAARRGRLGWETAKWAQSAGLAVRNEERFARPSYVVVRYEELVARPVETLTMLCGLIGESVEPAMVEVASGLHFDVVSPSPVCARFVERAVAQDLLRFGYRASGGADGSTGGRRRPRPLDRCGAAAWRMTDQRLARRTGR